MSEHVKLLRFIGELGNPRSREKEVAEDAADHIEALEVALRDSTELLRGIYRASDGDDSFCDNDIENQIAANEAVLGVRSE